MKKKSVTIIIFFIICLCLITLPVYAKTTIQDEDDLDNFLDTHPNIEKDLLPGKDYTRNYLYEIMFGDYAINEGNFITAAETINKIYDTFTEGSEYALSKGVLKNLDNMSTTIKNIKGDAINDNTKQEKAEQAEKAVGELDNSAKQAKKNSEFKFPSISDLFTRANGFIDRGDDTDTITDNALVGPVVGIGRLLMGIAAVVLVIVTIVMAIKYMVADPQEQAKLKTQLVGLAISAAVIFGAFTIWQVSVNIMTSVTGG